jgi:multiple sugar transport system substrate-binding protein
VFEAGHVAMIFDGEWRTKMIQNDGVKFDWATAPFPAADDNPDLYGKGRAGGTICGIPSGAKNGDAAWLLVQYMSTDTDFLVSLANMLGNVPTTAAAASSPDFVPPPNFQTFIDVWDDPNSSWQPPIVPTGRGYNDYFATFDVKWINHQTDDLQGGLREVDTQIDNEISMGQAP